MFRNASKEQGKRNTASLNAVLLSPVKGRRYNTERGCWGGKQLLL